MINNVKLVKWNINIATEYTNFKNYLIEHKCLYCNDNYNWNLKKRFFNTYKFSNHDNNRFALFLRKGVYPCDHMDD